MLTDLMKSIKTDAGYLADCPLCGESYSLQIYPGDVWRCVSCDKTGTGDDLKKMLGDSFVDLIEVKTHAPEGLIVVSEYVKPKITNTASTGFNPVDKMLGGLAPGMVTVMTGKRGEGKSTFAGQLALHIINDGGPVCFYSGELNAGTFQDWITTQAAGPRYVVPQIDRFGAEHYHCDQWIEQRILNWLGKKLILYDNSIVKSSERNSILDRFLIAKKIYGCDVFFVDNLMTARISIDQERDFYRAQSNFVRDLTEFAVRNDVHVVLIAHPRKSSSSDKNDDVAGTGDITNLASNVIYVRKKDNAEWDSEIEITKNRRYGTVGAIRFNFDARTRRFNLFSGDQVDRLGWEDNI